MEKPNIDEREIIVEGVEVSSTPQAEVRTRKAEFYRSRLGMGQSGLPAVRIEQVLETETALEEGE